MAKRPQERPAASTVLEYQRPCGKGLTYTIEAWKDGFYRISLADRVLKTGHDPLVVVRMRRPGPDVELDAVAAARSSITLLNGMADE